MKAGKIRYIFLIFIFYSFFLNADDKISTVPLVNLEELKPSYEEIEDKNSKIKTEKRYALQEKNIKKNKGKITTINLLGLDKITAKTSEISIKIGETKKFGLLEIKAIKCGVTESINEKGEAAYIQIKDLSDNQNEKVFVFNGWTFSSSPSLRSVEHPVYDVWLVSCENV